MKKILVESIRRNNEKYNAAIVAYALMPEHFHLICYFQDEMMLSEYMRDIKKFTSFRIRKYWEKNDPEVLKLLSFQNREQKFKVWMDRFDDVVLYSPDVIIAKLEYINNNPAERGIVDNGGNYTYCSDGFYKTEQPGPIEVMHVNAFL